MHIFSPIGKKYAYFSPTDLNFTKKKTENISTLYGSIRLICSLIFTWCWLFGLLVLTTWAQLFGLVSSTYTSTNQWRTENSTALTIIAKLWPLTLKLKTLKSQEKKISTLTYPENSLTNPKMESKLFTAFTKI